uniref:hypothetical protein n=1 Tax=uncultured Ruminobacter sp. TaxID=538947 RepID=UPI0025D4085E
IVPAAEKRNCFLSVDTLSLPSPSRADKRPVEEVGFYRREIVASPVFRQPKSLYNDNISSGINL